MATLEHSYALNLFVSRQLQSTGYRLDPSFNLKTSVFQYDSGCRCDVTRSESLLLDRIRPVSCDCQTDGDISAGHCTVETALGE